MVGFNGGTVINNFALDTMIANLGGGFENAGVLANHGTSKSIDEFKSQSTYESGLGWKFENDKDNPWKIDESVSYPYLYWENR
ncbi:MAG: hypothetical protein LBP89_00735 [Helicobacteraceae bacterium]|jgi:hypothetical protein|nr:hypothetical protein [Helicobacteraceae bacterium]